MNPQNTALESTSSRVFNCARRRVLASPGKFIFVAVMLAAMVVFTLLPVSGGPGQGKGHQGQPGHQGQQGRQDDDSESKI